MFSASIAIISEVETNTMLRLKLSKLRAWEYLAGVSIVQVVIGIIAIFLTLAVAVAMGFDLHGSLITLTLIAVLTSISIVAFSLIIAAATKTANEILIVGNFPLFLFMFFTGAAFPIKAKALFHHFRLSRFIARINVTNPCNLSIEQDNDNEYGLQQM